jgi:CheY-like chemotaxis protein
MKLFRIGKRKAAEKPPVAGEILIIDDTPENLRLLNQILSDHGYKVRALPNGPMGISACKASPPDLVLLDITMPGMNGYEVAAKLKADAATKEVPIIFISAMTRTEDKVRAFHAGGVDYVTKPLQVEEVLARVETHLSISRMREQIERANQKLLLWNVKLSQTRSSLRSNSGIAVPDRLAGLFGKASPELCQGDSTEVLLSILAATSPSSESLARVENGLVTEHDGHVLARFSNVIVGISPDPIDSIARWIETSGEFRDLSASLGEGEGLLQICTSESDGSALRLEFQCPEVLKVVSALTPPET